MSVEVVEEIFEQLKGLSPQEQAIIRPVLERDLEFQRREKARVRQLKSMVDMHLVDQGSSAPPLSARRRSAYGLMNSLSSDSMMSVCSLRSNKPSLTAKELIAASGEWVDGGDPAEISEVLLAQMRRAAIEKEKMEGEKSPNGQPRAPMLSKRNLTLPTIATPSLLAVPSESEITANNNLSPSQKFWGGSPSPRSPQQYLIGSPNYVNITVPTPPPDALHPDVCQREIVGSPSPRSNPTFLMGNSPVRGGAVPITEVAPPTPTNSGQLRSPMSGSRRTAFANSKRYDCPRRNTELALPTFRLTPC
ncbi:hypothetical protein OESDEN_00433 [Oesophagostomum dentatum]|uniref:RabBD domain-containing protein n=1 Tax=Oesophagostomum dentatum TaxID=61180 RepID=A0A0B1TQR7_OESDE|nr:hypothetical protein OESDEN_00433 [Oesophagostomum dentatum]